jgi:hypothetical protein
VAINLSMRDASLEVMRGNLDKKSIAEKQPQQAQPVAPPPSVNVDMTPVADAILAANQSSQQMMAQVMSIVSQPAAPVITQSGPSKWLFRITERDRAGNIVSFEAIPK